MLASRDALAGEEVEAPAVLHHPASVGKLAVNQDPGTLFSGEPLLVGHSPFCLPAMASPAGHLLGVQEGCGLSQHRHAGRGHQSEDPKQ